MFGIGFFEVCIIAIAILVFFGPSRLPELMKQIGGIMFEFKKMSSEVNHSIESAMKQAERDALKKAEDKKIAPEKNQEIKEIEIKEEQNS